MELYLYAFYRWTKGESLEIGKLDRTLVHAKG